MEQLLVLGVLVGVHLVGGHERTCWAGRFLFQEPRCRGRKNVSLPTEGLGEFLQRQVAVAVRVQRIKHLEKNQPQG